MIIHLQNSDFACSPFSHKPTILRDSLRVTGSVTGVKEGTSVLIPMWQQEAHLPPLSEDGGKIEKCRMLFAGWGTGQC